MPTLQKNGNRFVEESDNVLVAMLLREDISLYGQCLTERLRRYQALLLRLLARVQALEAKGLNVSEVQS